MDEGFELVFEDLGPVGGGVEVGPGADEELLDGDDSGFMSRVAHRTAPPKPKADPAAPPGEPAPGEPALDKPNGGGDGL